MKRQNSKSLGIDVLAAGVRSISGMQRREASGRMRSLEKKKIK
jgi:hypothetical protein